MWDFNYYWPRWEDKGGRALKKLCCCVDVGYSMMNIGDTLLKKLCCCVSAGYCMMNIEDTLPKKLWSCGLLHDKYRGYVTKETVALRRWGEGWGGGVPGMM